MKITVVGCGYVGLVTGVCFAELRHQVVCVDIDDRKMRDLQRGIMPIYEPELDALLTNNLAAERVSFTSDLAQAMVGAPIVFIAVGTPSGVDGHADLKHVMGVARTLGQTIVADTTVVVKSTVSVGTCAKVSAIVQAGLSERGVEARVDVVSNPEFLREGSAVQDCLHPARIIVGADCEHAEVVMRTLYQALTKDNAIRLITMDIKSAELTKYAANAMLATKISFMNELSLVSERVGANIEKMREGIGSDYRIGEHFIAPGLGYGGSCFPKDVRALIKTAEEVDVSLDLLCAVEKVNFRQRERFCAHIFDYFNGSLADKKLAMWGLAFKPRTDDVRDAPALYIMDKLRSAGAAVIAYDPVAQDNVQKIYQADGKVSFSDNQYDALEGADALCICTEWDQFKTPDFAKMRANMRAFVIFDGRNIYDHAHAEEMNGCHYQSVGRS